MKKLILLGLLGLLTNACTQMRYTDSNIVEEQYVHQYGVEVDSNDWMQRGQNGAVITTLKNGVVVSKNFAHGILEGDTSYTFPHSQTIEKVETYANGLVVKEIRYDISGSPRFEIEYPTEQKKIVTTWSDSGLPQCREEYRGAYLEQGSYFTRNNQIESKIVQGHGTKILRDFYGELLAKENYTNGQVVLRAMFYQSGTPKEQIAIRNGIAHGHRKTFHSDGEPNTVEEWRDGVQMGLTTVFKNGEKFAEVPYYNGSKNGIEKRFKNGTTLVQEITWKDNIQHGPTYSYIGDKTITDWYFQGRQISKSQFDQMTQPL